MTNEAGRISRGTFIDNRAALELELSRQFRRDRPDDAPRGRQARHAAPPSRGNVAPSRYTRPLTHREASYTRAEASPPEPDIPNLGPRLHQRAAQRAMEQEAERQMAMRAAEAELAADRLVEARKAVRKRVAIVFLAVAFLATLAFFRLVQQGKVEKQIVYQNQLTRSIEDEERQIGALRVEINRVTNISSIQEYARAHLHMDYPGAENTRVIALPTLFTDGKP